MGYNENNKFAEKWTRDEALEFVKEALTILEQNLDIFFAGEVAERQHTYRQAYWYLFDKFKDNDFDIIKREFENILESRCYVMGAKNKINPTMAIFGLKNHYGWKDKTEIDMNAKVSEGDPFKKIRDNLDEPDE